jgi:hypothetical protein
MLKEYHFNKTLQLKVATLIVYNDHGLIYHQCGYHSELV